MNGLLKPALLLAIVAIGFFGYFLHSQNGIFHEFEAALLSVQWMLLVCLAVWFGTFVFLMFNLNDLPLVILLLIAIAAYCIGYSSASTATDAIIFLAGVTMGKSAFVLLWRDEGENNAALVTFLVGLVMLLAFSSWWHLDMAGAYHGPRWMGIWNNPNIYGMLMGTGTTLAIGLQVLSLKSKIQSPKSEQKRKLIIIFLFIAITMMGVGLVMSYSRGAMLATSVGLLYLAWSYGKLKWRWVLPGILIIAAVVCVFWHSTADSGPWYLKRLDFSRPSAQHRVSAWHGAMQMMRDHPFGVGWNKAVSIYEKSYSPPENGAAALTMNSYLMLGTELGLPALLCFIAYIFFKFKANVADSLQVTCRAGAIVLIVAFWFDGGLFTLATAGVFWILLELGSASPRSLAPTEV